MTTVAVPVEPSLLVYAVLILIGYFLFRRFVLERYLMDMRGKWVFITGCDTGFGNMLAKRLVRSGVHVIAGCYTLEGYNELDKLGLHLKNQRKKEPFGFLEAVQLDIGNAESVRLAAAGVEKLVRKNKGRLHAVVNNAGIFSVYGPVDWCTEKEYEHSLNVNAVGAVRVTEALKHMIKESRGRIVTMGSTAARLHGKYVAPYNVAKAALESYMDCLRLEMNPFGVSVHLLEPGAFKTGLLDQGAMYLRVHRIWDRLTEKMKSHYGEDYLSNFTVVWQKGVNKAASSDLSWVIWCYVHALFAHWPRLRYQPGYDAVSVFIPLSLCPTFIQDLLLDRMYALSSRGLLTPAVLKEHPVRFHSTTSFLLPIGLFSIFSLCLVQAIQYYCQYHQLLSETISSMWMGYDVPSSGNLSSA